MKQLTTSSVDYLKSPRHDFLQETALLAPPDKCYLVLLWLRIGRKIYSTRVKYPVISLQLSQADVCSTPLHLCRRSGRAISLFKPGFHGDENSQGWGRALHGSSSEQMQAAKYVTVRKNPCERCWCEVSNCRHAEPLMSTG